jgi:hypothetical protein
MIRKLTYLILSILLILSCNKNNLEKDNTLIIKYDKSKKKSNIFEVIKDVKLYKLAKQNEEIILPNIRNIIKIKKKYFYSSDINNGTFLISDSIGNLHSSFNKLGPGPQEYSELTCFDVDDDYIYIYDFQKQNIKIYDYAGNFQKSNKIAYYFRDFIKTDYGYVLFTAKHSNKINEELLNFDLLLINNTGNVLKKYFPFNPDFYSTVRLHKSSPFYKTNNTLLFNDLMSDSIFSIGTKNIDKKLKYSFMYKTKTLTKAQINQPQDILIKDLLKISNSSEDISYFANLKYISSENILYNYKKGASSIYVFFNKKNNSEKLYSFNKINIENESIFSPFFNEDDNLVSLIHPYSLTFLKNEYLKYNGKDSIFIKRINKLINNTEEDGNQLVMKYKLKN